MTPRSLWMDRRRVAGPAAALALAVLGVWGGTNGAARAAGESPASEPITRATRLTKRFALELDGQVVGLVDGVSGGGVKAEVIDEPSGPEGILRKRLGPPRLQEITLQVGLSMAPAFYQWIAQTWAAGSAACRVPRAEPDDDFPPGETAGARLDPALRRNGAILELDDSSVVRARREFVNALITEVTVPALDVAEKKPGFLTVKIAPESLRFVRGDTVGPTSGAIRLESRAWLPCHFRVVLNGLDETRITRVETFTVRTVVSRAAERLMIQTPILSLTLTEAGADPWFDWLEGFTLHGNPSPAQEKNGAILLLSPGSGLAQDWQATVARPASASRAELARIDLRGVGLCGLTPASTDTSEYAGRGSADGPPPAGADRSARPHLTANLYMQRIGFSAAAAAQPEAPTPNPRRGLRFQSILK